MSLREAEGVAGCSLLSHWPDACLRVTIQSMCWFTAWQVTLLSAYLGWLVFLYTTKGGKNTGLGFEKIKI